MGCLSVSSAVRYQVMPPLSSEEYQELFESIKSEGIHEPIHVDEEGVVIDGHHRSQIAKELGIPCPVITHDDLNEAGKRSLAFTLNLKRRHLNREQRRALITESLKSDPQLSNREHARRTGVSHNTVNSVRDELQSGGQIDHLEERTAPDGKSYPASQPKRETDPAPGFNPGELDELNHAPTAPQKPRAEAITSQFSSAITELNRAMSRLHRMTKDNNYPNNKAKIAELHRSDISRTISELQEIADSFN